MIDAYDQLIDDAIQEHRESCIVATIQIGALHEPTKQDVEKIRGQLKGADAHLKEQIKVILAAREDAIQ